FHIPPTQPSASPMATLAAIAIAPAACFVSVSFSDARPGSALPAWPGSAWSGLGSAVAVVVAAFLVVAPEDRETGVPHGVSPPLSPSGVASGRHRGGRRSCQRRPCRVTLLTICCTRPGAG